MGYLNIENISDFCYKIEMPKNIINLIAEKICLIDESEISGFYYDFFCFGKAEETYKKLQQYTDTLDSDKICELTVLLAFAIRSYDKYKEKNISDKVYIDTMKCFSRFINETYKWTGKYTFDRGFWVWRQISLVLFRVGQLEFEIFNVDENTAEKLNINKGEQVLNVHIPNDAICTREQLNLSYKEARDFFKKYFNKEYEFICSSWLLGKELGDFIKRDGGIYNFRKDYEVVDYFESDDYLQWAFDRYSGDIKEFQPKTKLQKAIKIHLLNGGKMTVGTGIIKNKKI